MRPTRDEYFMMLALVVSTRSTCARRAVGCVLVDNGGRVLSTGFNGVARGMVHCHGSDAVAPCPAALAPSGTGLDGCHAIHAEQNALLQTRGGTEAVHTCYVTVSPCVTCVKLLMNTGCERVAFLDPYPHEDVAAALWLASRRPKRAGVPRQRLRAWDAVARTWRIQMAESIQGLNRRDGLPVWSAVTTVY